MRRIYAIPMLIAAVVVIPTSGQAKEITLTLSDKEQAALRQIFDLAVRQGGLAALGNVQYFMQKMAAPPTPKVKTEKVDPNGAVVNDELLKKP